MIGPKSSENPSFSQQNCGGRTIIVQYPLISFDSLSYHLEKSNHVLWTKISVFLGCRSCLQLKFSSWMGMTKVHFQGSCHLWVREDNPRTYLALLFDDWCWNPSALLCVSLKTSGSPKAPCSWTEPSRFGCQWTQIQVLALTNHDRNYEAGFPMVRLLIQIYHVRWRFQLLMIQIYHVRWIWMVKKCLFLLDATLWPRSGWWWVVNRLVASLSGLAQPRFNPFLCDESPLIIGEMVV